MIKKTGPKGKGLLWKALYNHRWAFSEQRLQWYRRIREVMTSTMWIAVLRGGGRPGRRGGSNKKVLGERWGARRVCGDQSRWRADAVMSTHEMEVEHG